MLSDNLVRRYRKSLDISAVRRKKINYKYPLGSSLNFTENKLIKNNKRDFTVSKSNELWCSDITYLNRRNSKSQSFLFAIKDVYDHRIVDYAVFKTFNVANILKVMERSFENNETDNLTVHTDQGFQFTHILYKQLLDKWNVTRSMSRRGVSPDNGPIESFFSTLKFEIELKKLTQMNHADSRKLVSEYINYYNNNRIQVSLDGLTPIEYNNNMSFL